MRKNKTETQSHTPHTTHPLAIHTTHHPPSHITSRHHTQSGKEARNTEGEQDNTKVPDPTRRRGHHSPPPFKRTTMQTERETPILNEGDANVRREGQHCSTRPSLTMPPHLVMPPHHPRQPHPTPRMGEGHRRTPHHTNTTHRHAHPHTAHPATNSSMIRQQY